MAGVNGAVEAGGALDAELALLLMNHANMHFQQLQQKNPDQAAPNLYAGLPASARNNVSAAGSVAPSVPRWPSSPD